MARLVVEGFPADLLRTLTLAVLALLLCSPGASAERVALKALPEYLQGAWSVAGSADPDGQEFEKQDEKPWATVYADRVVMSSGATAQFLVVWKEFDEDGQEAELVELETGTVWMLVPQPPFVVLSLCKGDPLETYAVFLVRIRPVSRPK